MNTMRIRRALTRGLLEINLSERARRVLRVCCVYRERRYGSTELAEV